MSETILGIHSNVRPGMLDPSTGKLRDPNLIDGHGWLTVTRDGVTTNLGLWPDDHPRVVGRGLSNGSGSDVRRAGWKMTWPLWPAATTVSRPSR